jgi:hypothetical protein
MERAATRIATANEKTMPTLAKVRSSPDAVPKARPGASFITAALLAGKKPPAPTPLTMAATVITQSGVTTPTCA